MSTLATDQLLGLHAGIAFKAPARVATTAAITLSGLQTIDGVALAAGDRVLVKDQTNGVENGIYVASTSSWTRAPDFDSFYDARNGTQVRVNAGVSHGNSGLVYYLSTADPVVIGTSSLTFTVQTDSSWQSLLPNIDAVVTSTDEELNFVDGVTSSIQTQLNAKLASSAFPNVAGTVTPTHTELNFVDGVTSSIQDQLNTKVGSADWTYNSGRYINNGNTQTSFAASVTSSLTSGSTVIFNSEGHDYGGSYNHTTGVFTAPIAGVYLFCTSLAFLNVTGSKVDPRVFISKGGVYIASCLMENVANGATGGVSMSAIVALNVSDTVSVTTNVTFTANLYPEYIVALNHFSGRLLG